jgi:hypothetical protein
MASPFFFVRRYCISIPFAPESTLREEVLNKGEAPCYIALHPAGQGGCAGQITSHGEQK